MPLSQQDIEKYKELYIKTATNYLNNMQASASFLLNGQQMQNAIKQVHLDAHSLKSQSQIMGYNHIAKICEIIEFLFNRAEKENIQIPHDVLVKIQSDVACLIDSVHEIEKNGKELDLTDKITELEKAKV